MSGCENRNLFRKKKLSLSFSDKMSRSPSQVNSAKLFPARRTESTMRLHTGKKVWLY